MEISLGGPDLLPRVPRVRLFQSRGSRMSMVSGYRVNVLLSLVLLFTGATFTAFGQGAKAAVAPPADRAAASRAAKALEGGDAKAAERLYRQAMRLNPKRADWPTGLGLALERE